MYKIKMPMLPETTLGYVKKILEPHGSTIEVHEQPEEGDRFPCWLLLLPEGTKKEREGFTGAYHEHNKITLPDGLSVSGGRCGELEHYQFSYRRESEMSTYFVYDHHDDKEEQRRLTIQDR